MSTKYLIIGGAAFLGLIVLFVILIFAGSGGPAQPVTLQFWGTFDDSTFYDDAIREFRRQNPGISIIYRKLNFEDYEKQLIDSFAAGTGPDIWLMHNTWLPKHADKIEPMPADLKNEEGQPLMTLKGFQDQFVDVAARDLIAGGRIYSLPVYIDTLGLYYNKDVFNTLGITQPPKTWDEFNEAVKKITLIDQRGNLSRSGAAIGTSRNVNRSTDILMLLMLQSGVQMTDPTNSSATFADSVDNSDVGEIALRYYTDFANSSKQVYTWNDQQHFSIDAFVEGNAAMMINYSHQIEALRGLSSRFNFATAPVPQISSETTAVNYANYWAPTVSKQSKNADAAWRFLVFLSSGRGDAYYVNASGRPSARRDLLEQQKNDPDLGPFALQALSARSWYQTDSSVIETIFADMIDDVNLGRATTRNAINSAENKVNALMASKRNSF